MTHPDNTPHYRIAAPSGKDEISAGDLENLEIQLEETISKVEGMLKILGADLRKPCHNEISHEGRLRKARGELKSLELNLNRIGDDDE